MSRLAPAKVNKSPEEGEAQDTPDNQQRSCNEPKSVGSDYMPDLRLVGNSPSNGKQLARRKCEQCGDTKFQKDHGFSATEL